VHFCSQFLSASRSPLRTWSSSSPARSCHWPSHCHRKDSRCLMIKNYFCSWSHRSPLIDTWHFVSVTAIVMVPQRHSTADDRPKGQEPRKRINREPRAQGNETRSEEARSPEFARNSLSALAEMCLWDQHEGVMRSGRLS